MYKVIFIHEWHVIVVYLPVKVIRDAIRDFIEMLLLLQLSYLHYIIDKTYPTSSTHVALYSLETSVQFAHFKH